MFFRRQTYNVNNVIENIVSLIEELDECIFKLQEDVEYLIETLDERA